MPSAIEVVILQHPLEVNNTKGTARLLHLSLPNSQLEIGEQFSTDRWLHDGTMNSPARCEPRTTYLLYPPLPGAVSVENEVDHVVAAPALAHLPLRLIVLDATWRKSRKMLHLNPTLRALPRMTLEHLPASRYRIRKAARPEQLSTLEATCHALQQLGDASAPIEQLLCAFDAWVRTTQARIDQHVLQRTRAVAYGAASDVERDG